MKRNVYLILLLMLVSSMVVYLGLVNFYKTQQRFINLSKESSIQEAKALFENIVTMRSWNANHGGVYVKQHDNLQPNRYLKNNFIYAQNGELLIKINPAWMTRQIAEMMDSSKGYLVHITSLKPINPQNSPDKFEQEALAWFDTHKDQRYFMKFSNTEKQLHFIGSLDVKPECLGCHLEQGYKLGDIRGGIRVSIPIENLQQSIQHINDQTRELSIIVIALTLLVYTILLTLLKSIVIRQQKISRLNIGLHSQVLERTQHLETAKDQLQEKLNLEQIRSELFGILLTKDFTIEDLSLHIAKNAQQITLSPLVFAASIDKSSHDLISYALTNMMNADKQQIPVSQKIVFPCESPGVYPKLWGHALNTRTAFYTNSPADHPSSQGTPEGHIPLVRFAAVPVLLNEQLLGEIAIANKAQDYSEHDLLLLERLAEFYALGVHHLRIREDLKLLRLREQVHFKDVKRLSITDPLTSLYNRRHFDAQFKRQLNLAKRLNLNFGLILLDLDHFKLYNDHYGHQQGDVALIAVAEVLQQQMRRSTELAFRVGGEEFACIIVSDQSELTEQMAEYIREEVFARQIEHLDNVPYRVLTVSIGLRIIHKQQYETFEVIYKHADDALYFAKQNGRNRICVNNET